MRLRLRHVRRQILRQASKRKKALRNIIRWSDGAVPEALRGMAGILRADEILKAHKAVGLLIGGCAKAIWAGRTPEDLAKHKDVDVVALSYGFRPAKPFEGGIDWWRRSRPYRYENGNGVVLSWTPSDDAPPGTKPGLLVPDRRTMACILAAEWTQRHPVRQRERPYGFRERLIDRYVKAMVKAEARRCVTGLREFSYYVL